jgi:hypothetical protein
MKNLFAIIFFALLLMVSNRGESQDTLRAIITSTSSAQMIINTSNYSNVTVTTSSTPTSINDWRIIYAFDCNLNEATYVVNHTLYQYWIIPFDPNATPVKAVLSNGANIGPTSCCCQTDAHTWASGTCTLNTDPTNHNTSCTVNSCTQCCDQCIPTIGWSGSGVICPASQVTFNGVIYQ